MDAEQKLIALSKRRWRVAISLTLAEIVIYFGFLIAVAFAKPTMGTEITHGLSIGIVLGALQIVAAWVLTLIYVRWANKTYDPELARVRAEGSLR